ncbi:PIG-L family deacetylase [Piscinibacter sp. XHJ-5]|uniref:PIG-L deacetylase family protein n=1 Tax=Piscinibacter sp. XHJ-5 TaxID=3037797 RepID=UPI002452A47C|nr:PIG-L family deacetylase [Piscinibacter sp. XHJ-5]
MKTALVLAAHPDDEVLGCGGTIARMADQGWQVHILILAEGATSRSVARDRSARTEELSALETSARRAASILGAASVQLEAFADNRMDGVELLDVVKRIEDEMARVQPSRVLTHHLGDVNVDHGIVHQAAVAACRPLPGSCVRELLFFEVASSTEWRPASSMAPFRPNLFVDIGSTLQRKLDALQAYASEMRPFPHARSVQALEHLARWRGATAGCEAAEAFEIGRRIE